MNTNRRNFLLKTAAVVPGVAFADAAQGLSGASNFNGRNQLRDSQSKEESWLNVRDCGVSGSTFETTAATSSGSRQITVTNVGDFKVGQGVMVSKCNIRYERTQSRNITAWSVLHPGITYLRCSVTDSVRNAFNDVNSSDDNTSILNCRIVDVGGNAWEGASRFIKFIGNYIRKLFRGS